MDDKSRLQKSATVQQRRSKTKKERETGGQQKKEGARERGRLGRVVDHD